MNYEQDHLYKTSPDHKIIFVAGMPWASRDQAVLSDQQTILATDGVVAVDVISPFFAAGLVGVAARRLNISEMAEFAQDIPATLSYLETQVVNGGVNFVRYFVGSGSTRTWAQDLRNATTLAQQLLPKLETRLQNEGGNSSDIARVRVAENAVSDVARRAHWQKKP